MRKMLFAAAMAMAGLLAQTGRGMFINNSVQLPVARVVANVEKWIKDKPADAQGFYVLGRIHAMAWAYGPELNLWGAAGTGRLKDPPATVAADPFNGQLPGFAPYDSVQVRRTQAMKQVTAQDAGHLEESIKNYTKATELDPKNALYELGLAWILQETGKVAKSLPADFMASAAQPTDVEKAAFDAAVKKLGDTDAAVREQATGTLRQGLPKSMAILRTVKSDDPEVTARVDALLKTYWDLQALDHYRKAYSVRLEQDLTGRGGLRTGDAQVAAEAGEAILEILKSQPQAAKANEAAEVAANVKTIRGKPMAVTPVIFAMPGQPAAELDDLVDSAKRVSFDLAGDQVPRTWPWLKNGTALLVWDPALTGQISNGRQLFGSRTWWIFFRDGYEALSVLDDNRDGMLTGAELQGIATWVDRNGNAISERGEVVSLEQAGIVSIGVKARTDAAGTLVSDRGIGFADGTVVKSFDWVTRPAASASQNQP
jgi:hypothetical protein